MPLLSTRNAEATGQWLSHVMISDLALFNFLYLYDVASEVSPMWLTPVYLLFVQVAVMCYEKDLQTDFYLFNSVY